ncbi:MAG TPA: hypothetical protein VLA22_11285 [Gaiellaceae bacterium]|nr:hypothetical protein [Gaiellaceae bacterium]
MPALPAAPVNPQPDTRAHLTRTLATLAVLALGALAALSLASPASAAWDASATKCGKQVLADWFDNGRIDRIYPLNCYEEAIDAIPDDLRDYADAEEVITRALQSALRGELAPGGEDPTPGNDDRQGGEGGKGGKGGKGGAGGSGGSGGGGSSNGGTGTSAQATPDVNTSGPSSVPVPLLVLGGISLALLAAGSLGYLSRRRQAARVSSGDDFDTLA